jgi:hypothetical protein
MTSKELIQNGSIWKNNTDTWSRRCPQCNKTVNHSGSSDRRMKDVCRKAHLQKCVCVSCSSLNKIGVELKPSPEGVWKNGDSWCRACPECKKTIAYKGKQLYKVKNKCIKFHQLQKTCKICSASKRKKDIPTGVWTEGGFWYCKCPKCEVVKKYKDNEWAKYICIRSVVKKSTCEECKKKTLSEKQTGKKLSPEWCKNIGNSKRGPKNPWFGKKRSAEFCKMLSEANKGKKNPQYGKPIPPELVHKKMLAFEKNKYQKKEYIFPDGAVVFVQGYEPFTLDYLIKNGVKDLKTSAADMPKIEYQWNGKTRRYYPDCLVGDIVVETKSIYTWFCDEERNQAKLRASIMQGYNVELFVWERKNLILKSHFKKNVEPIFLTKKQIERLI